VSTLLQSAMRAPPSARLQRLGPLISTSKQLFGRPRKEHSL
jgi:hypothetical protein